ncbi:hypothetical protein ACHAWC_007111 [Mediolabrus comicus]
MNDHQGGGERSDRRKTKKSLSNYSLAAAMSVLLVLFGLLRGVNICSQFNGSNVNPEHHREMVMRKGAIDADLPYKCGVFFFFHIPSTGGRTINLWLQGYQKYDVPYFTRWGNIKGKSSWSAVPRVRKRFISGMNEFVKNIGPNEWKIVQAHHNSFNIDENEELLYQWRSSVEQQGCHFVSSVMFRDSLSHSLSLYKHIERFNSTREEWNENPDGVEKDVKVERALQLLRDHFDIITVGQHDRFESEFLRITGLEKIPMKKANVYPKELNFTKKEIETLHRLLEDNGDIDFIYRVKRIYNER